MDLASDLTILDHRMALDKDIDSMYDLYMNEESNPYLTYDPMDKESFRKIYDELLLTGTLYVVEINQQLVASYRLIRKRDRQAHTLYLGGFVVDHSMKGKGIGSKALLHIKNSSATGGIKRIELTVDIENKMAINLYKKIGFLIEGYIRKSYRRSSTSEYYDEYLMGLIL